MYISDNEPQKKIFQSCRASLGQWVSSKEVPIYSITFSTFLKFHSPGLLHGHKLAMAPRVSAIYLVPLPVLLCKSYPLLLWERKASPTLGEPDSQKAHAMAFCSFHSAKEHCHHTPILKGTLKHKCIADHIIIKYFSAWGYFWYIVFKIILLL